MNWRRWFSKDPHSLTPSTRHKFESNDRLSLRQIEKRAELVANGINIDRPPTPIDYERGLPIG